MGTHRMIERDLAPGDIRQLVSALLESIERGELDASPKDVEFLRSVADILPETNTAA